jgi:hypothetical protein
MNVVSRTPTCVRDWSACSGRSIRTVRFARFSAIDRALAALDRNASPKIVADWLAFQI